jgi:hypothetical protein
VVDGQSMRPAFCGDRLENKKVLSDKESFSSLNEVLRLAFPRINGATSLHS